MILIFISLKINDTEYFSHVPVGYLCVFIDKKVNSFPLHIFLPFFFDELYEFSVYLLFSFLITYAICKYLLPYSRLLFCFVNSFSFVVKYLF